MSKPSKVKSIRLPQELEQVIASNSENSKMTESAYIRKLIADGLKKDKEKIDITWESIKDKLVYFIANILSTTNSKGTFEYIKELKSRGGKFFAKDTNINLSLYTKSSFETSLMEVVEKAVNKINPIPKMLISTVIITYSSILFDAQILEPYGLGYYLIEQLGEISKKY